MRVNVGTADRSIRFVVGLILIVAPLINLFGLGGSTVIAYLVMAIGGILVLTGVFGMCPIYRILGISTRSD